MAIEKADVVRSLAGRDAGELFFVSSTDGEYAQIVNGRDRRTDRPKRKKLKHQSRNEAAHRREGDQQRIETGAGGKGRRRGRRRYAKWRRMT